MSVNEVNSPSLAEDAFLWKLVILIISIFAIQTFAHFIDVSSVLAIPVALISPIIEASFLYFGIKHIVKRRYKSAMSLMLAIPLLMLVAGIPFIYGGCTLKTARYIKVTLSEDQYLKAINETKPDAHGFRFKEFPWGGFMSNPVILVYDESDELALPQEQRSEAWWKKLRDSPFAQCRYSVQKIKSHFYAVDFGC